MFNRLERENTSLETVMSSSWCVQETPDFLTVPLLCVSARPALVERKPPELSTLNDGYQIRI